jgi:uncharacterized protein (DUF433 family)
MDQTNGRNPANPRKLRQHSFTKLLSPASYARRTPMISAIAQHPHIMSGAPCFAGTRVPVATLFDNLNDGATLDQFVEWFPGVSLSQAKEVLKLAAEQVLKAQKAA